MNKYNAAMRDMMNVSIDNIILHEDLWEIVRQGFMLEEECLFLKKLRIEKTIPPMELIKDETALEVFVNSFHTDDYISEQHLQQVLKMVALLKKIWKCDPLSGKSITPIAIISRTDFGFNFKLFRKRTNQTYLADDIETYEQPILQIEFD